MLFLQIIIFRIRHTSKTLYAIITVTRANVKPTYSWMETNQETIVGQLKQMTSCLPKPVRQEDLYVYLHGVMPIKKLFISTASSILFASFQHVRPIVKTM